MKKTFLVLSLLGVFVLGTTQLAFAGEVGSKGVGIKKLMEQGLTFDQAKSQKLEEKFSRVDAAVARAVITPERAIEIKAEMQAKSDSCTTPEEFKANKENYGLNKGLNKGNGQGKGKGQKQGQCNITATENN